MGNISKKLLSGSLWLNLLAMVAVVVLVCVVTRVGMDVYTHHGETVIVPNVMHKSMVDARKALEEAGLVVDASDTGFVRKYHADVVLEQNPIAGKEVKPGRVIFLKVNASKSPTIALPDIIDNCSMREAMARLKSLGFKLGMVEFVKGENEWIYGAKVDGKHVFAGDRISTDKELILMVGNGSGVASLDSVSSIEEDISEELF